MTARYRLADPRTAGKPHTDRYGQTFVSPPVDPIEGSVCFYCGEDITSPCVSWAGGTAYDVWTGAELTHDGSDLASIFLHPACALKFMTRLMRDVHELESKGVEIRTEMRRGDSR